MVVLLFFQPGYYDQCSILFPLSIFLNFTSHIYHDFDQRWNGVKISAKRLLGGPPHFFSCRIPPPPLVRGNLHRNTEVATLAPDVGI